MLKKSSNNVDDCFTKNKMSKEALLQLELQIKQIEKCEAMKSNLKNSVKVAPTKCETIVSEDEDHDDVDVFEPDVELAGQDNNTIVTGNKKNGRWTPEEDELLKQVVPCFQGRNWKKISEYIHGRTAIQCLHRWKKILQPGLVKGPWTIEEDRKLMEWVKIEGPQRWSICSEFIKGRNGKQCRERWFNALNPDVKKGNWTIEEDYNIFYLYNKYGSKWCKIVQLFSGRTENSIKNRFYSTLRRIHAERNFPKGVEKDRESSYNGHMDDNMTVSSSCLSELLKYIPEAYAEKAYRLAQIRGCHISELENYESPPNPAKKVEKPQLQAPASFDFKTPIGSKKNYEINIGNYNPIFNMSFNINSNNSTTIPTSTPFAFDGNFNMNNTIQTKIEKEEKIVSKPINPEKEFKDMSLAELEQNIINSCNADNMFLSDPNFGFLDSQIDHYLDGMCDSIPDDNNDASCFKCAFDDKTPLGNSLFDADLFLNSMNPKLDTNFSNTQAAAIPVLTPQPASEISLKTETENTFLNKQESVIKQLQNNVLNSVKDLQNSQQNTEDQPSLGNLLQVLNNLEQMLQSTKAEILKYDKKGEIKPNMI